MRCFQCVLGERIIIIIICESHTKFPSKYCVTKGFVMSHIFFPRSIRDRAQRKHRKPSSPNSTEWDKLTVIVRSSCGNIFDEENSFDTSNPFNCVKYLCIFAWVFICCGFSRVYTFFLTVNRLSASYVRSWKAQKQKKKKKKKRSISIK